MPVRDDAQVDRWEQMRLAPRRPARDVVLREVPAAPGVYTWWRDGDPVYVGEAKVSLRRRLRDHLKTSDDLSRSTLRRSAALAELGIPRSESAARPTRVSQANADFVSAWLRGCEVAWVECVSGAEAHALEAALRAESLPPLNRV